MSAYIIHNGELYHHGVKGMKWGVRKFQQKSAELDQKKAAYKKAKKSYNKAYNKAYNRSLAAYSPSKKQRRANDKRWDDAANEAERLKKAKTDYKSAKKEMRKHSTVGQKINRGLTKASKAIETIGVMYAADQVLNGGAGTRAVKAVVKLAGRAAVESYVKARGGEVLGWKD